MPDLQTYEQIPATETSFTRLEDQRTAKARPWTEEMIEVNESLPDLNL
jgi:hypothetical protein